MVFSYLYFDAIAEVIPPPIIILNLTPLSRLPYTETHFLIPLLKALSATLHRLYAWPDSFRLHFVSLWPSVPALKKLQHVSPFSGGQIKAASPWSRPWTLQEDNRSGCPHPHGRSKTWELRLWKTVDGKQERKQWNEKTGRLLSWHPPNEFILWGHKSVNALWVRIRNLCLQWNGSKRSQRWSLIKVDCGAS